MMDAERLEHLLNFTGALRPDLPVAELYELAAHALVELSGYPQVVLWLREHGAGPLRPLAVAGVHDAQRFLHGAALDDSALAALGRAGQHLGEMVWWPAGAPQATLPAPLAAVGGSSGHVLIAPLLSTELLGIAQLAGPAAEPERAGLAFLQQCVDQITVAISAGLTFAENERVQEELRRAITAQEALTATIEALSTPVLPLLNSVLLLPLVGGLDSQRMARINERLLMAVAEQHTRVVIVDITGLPIVDTQVAAALLDLTRALRLLGALVVMVGIRPEIAQTLVGLGVNLSEITTRATLSEGLRAAMGMVGLKIVPKQYN